MPRLVAFKRETSVVVPLSMSRRKTEPGAASWSASRSVCELIAIHRPSRLTTASVARPGSGSVPSGLTETATVLPVSRSRRKTSGLSLRSSSPGTRSHAREVKTA